MADCKKREVWIEKNSNFCSDSTEILQKIRGFTFENRNIWIFKGFLEGIYISRIYSKFMRTKSNYESTPSPIDWRGSCGSDRGIKGMYTQILVKIRIVSLEFKKLFCWENIFFVPLFENLKKICSRNLSEILGGLFCKLLGVQTFKGNTVLNWCLK